MTGRQIEILLVEDNPGDARLTLEALTESSIGKKGLTVVQDGVEALAFLHREGKYARAPRPDLILLDLNMPKMNGQAVLAEIKKDEVLKSIPVVVFTTSQSEDDVYRCYDLRANSYVTKPMDFDGFMATVKCIHSYWLETTTLPTACFS